MTFNREGRNVPHEYIKQKSKHQLIICLEFMWTCMDIGPTDCKDWAMMYLLESHVEFTERASNKSNVVKMMYKYFHRF